MRQRGPAGSAHAPINLLTWQGQGRAGRKPAGGRGEQQPSLQAGERGEGVASLGVCAAEDEGYLIPPGNPSAARLP